ncbi:tripartite tricarboxylate transporter TctB family protein [Celeribacter sp. SCSIO 80788]|uniref:tripartite tricarboxylate transporter TctB family protein n=1 Tax=Celeribacter sp. SCSIO 80788 TaxID=3117013 RepID=UPI003DA2D818
MSPKPASSLFIRALSDTNVVTGAFLFLLGGGAALMALGFDPSARNFPLIVSVIIALCGASIALRALRGDKHSTLPLHEFGVIAKAVGAIVLWGLALAFGLGFVIATSLLVLAMLWLAGMRRLGHGIILSVGITLVLFALFVVVLNVHLPDSFLSFIAPGV